MPIVTLSAFTNLNRRFDLQPNSSSHARIGCDQIRVCLMRIVLERCELGKRITQQIGYQTAEVIPLHVMKQRLSADGDQREVD